MTQLQCHRCEHSWNYQGDSDYYATCPNCKTTVTIDGETVQSGPYDEVPGFGAKCNYGVWRGPDLTEVDTTAIVKLDGYDDDTWLELEMHADYGKHANTKLSVVFDDPEIAKEFADKFSELAKEIDSQGEGTERLGE